MEHKKIAIIDCGTNTFHLMIAETRGEAHRIISRERIAVKIGAGGINHQTITREGIARGIAAMKEFRQKIDLAAVDGIFAFGTSALRGARNGADVADEFAAASGIQLRIISGEEEADYIYRGVREAVPMTSDSCLIVDIGGGSVEFIIGNGDQIFWKESLEIGAQRLLERFHKHDPIEPTEIQALNDYFDKTLGPVLEALRKFSPLVIIGSSGTFDTLSEMHCLENQIPYRETDPETPLTLNSFRLIFKELKTKNRSQRLAMEGMIEMRVDMIVVACCLIDYILNHHAFNSIRVSTYSLKEGVLASLS